MNITASVTNKFNENEVVVATDGSSKRITIPPKESGFGSSVNGGELLLLSLATCYCNDIYREAAKRNIIVTEVRVEFSGEFGAEGEHGRNFTYKPVIKSDASPQRLEELVTATDEIAEIHKTLRLGVEVKLLK